MATYNPKTVRKAHLQEGDVWGGGDYHGDAGGGLGYGLVVPAGYVYSNGGWVQPSVAQANNLASQQLGYEQQTMPAKAAATNAVYQATATGANKLNSLLSDPSSIADTPGYQWAYNQGLEAVNRTAAAKGLLGSGNRLYDLVNYGQGKASQTYNDTFNQLSSLLQNVQKPRTSYAQQGTAMTVGGAY